MYPMPYYKNSPLYYLPLGTVSLTRFAAMCGVPQRTVMIHVLQGINGDRIEVTKVEWQTRLYRYVTPEQQRKAFVFWDRHRVKYRKSVLAQQSEVAP